MSKFITDTTDGIVIIRKIERSVFIETREWFDKTHGNTYFSARINVDGKHVATLPFQYGYGDMHLYESATVLKELGYLPDDDSALWIHAQDMGFDLYTTRYEVKTKKEMYR